MHRIFALFATLHSFVGSALPATQSGAGKGWWCFTWNKTNVAIFVNPTPAEFCTKHFEELSTLGILIVRCMAPENISVVCRHIYHVLKDTLGPATSLFSWCACATHLVQVVHSTLASVVRKNNIRLSTRLVNFWLHMFTRKRNYSLILLRCIEY